MIDSEVTIIQTDHSEGRTTIETEVMVGNKGLEVNPDPQIRVQTIQDPELHLGLQAETMIYVFLADNLVILPKNSLRRTSPQEK